VTQAADADDLVWREICFLGLGAGGGVAWWVRGEGFGLGLLRRLLACGARIMGMVEVSRKVRL